MGGFTDHARALAAFRAARRALAAAPRGKADLRRAAAALRQARDGLLGLPVHPRLTVNLELFQTLLDRSTDAAFREFRLGGRRPAALVAIDGLVEREYLDKQVLEPLLLGAGDLPATAAAEELPALLRQTALPLQGATAAGTVGEGCTALFNGQALLLVDGMAGALALSAPGFKHRAVEEPVAEGVIRGPREGFIEALQINTSLLRRRVRTPGLKLERFTLGRQSRTPVVMAYLEGVAHPRLVAEVRRRLERIDVDAVVDSGYVEELIEDNPWSPFPQVQNTERPDTVAGNLLEGRVAILVDGSPHVLMVPTTFWSLLQASEDYYERFWIAGALRLLRYILLLVALMAPAFYIAVTTFHPEMLPTAFLLTIAAAREGIPFPAVVEAFLMEMFFEALREAGVRLPRPVGQAVSIVGALVIGQAAVQAGLASAPVVIVVATTGIASFASPRFNMAIAIRMLRFPLILLAGSLGLFGLMIGLAFILIHLVGLRSFGQPYLQPVAPITATDWKDVLVRVPHWLMGRLPGGNDAAGARRQAPYLQPSPRQRGDVRGEWGRRR